MCIESVFKTIEINLTAYENMHVMWAVIVALFKINEKMLIIIFEKWLNVILINFS